MKSTAVQILFFCLIPVGVFILYKSVQLLKKRFSGSVIIEIPFSNKSSVFELTKSGIYSIWHKGPIFTKAPLDQFRPVIRNVETDEEMELSSSLFRPNSNDGATSKMELFQFSAQAGTYKIVLEEGMSISRLEHWIIRLFPMKVVDLKDYYIQVRESQHHIITFAGIFLLALAGFCIIGGLVMGILAPQIFKG